MLASFQVQVDTLLLLCYLESWAVSYTAASLLQQSVMRRLTLEGYTVVAASCTSQMQASGMADVRNSITHTNCAMCC